MKLILVHKSDFTFFHKEIIWFSIFFFFSDHLNFKKKGNNIRCSYYLFFFSGYWLPLNNILYRLTPNNFSSTLGSSLVINKNALLFNIQISCNSFADFVVCKATSNVNWDVMLFDVSGAGDRQHSKKIQQTSNFPVVSP